MNSKTDFFSRAKTTGSGLLRQEGSLASMMLSKGKESNLRVHDIKPRCNPSTRRLDPIHVLDLAESIAALGLIEAIAVDSNHHLLAGGHRLCALQLLTANSIDRTSVWANNFDGEPDEKISSRLLALPVMADSVAVNLIPLDSSAEISRALAIEIAENERRRNFSREEIRGLAERLKSAGFRTERGRARSGEIAVIPALTAVLGKSRATVFRMLRDEEVPTGTTAPETRIPDPATEDRRLIKALQRWFERSPDSAHRGEVGDLIRMLGTSAS